MIKNWNDIFLIFWLNFLGIMSLNQTNIPCNIIYRQRVDFILS